MRAVTVTGLMPLKTFKGVSKPWALARAVDDSSLSNDLTILIVNHHERLTTDYQR